MATTYRRVAALRTPAQFREHLAAIDVKLPFDEELERGADAPLAAPLAIPGVGTAGNRFAVLPMEGWDCEPGGSPSALTLRRWQHFGLSGAKLIWGGEAAAVRHDGRANPNQLMVSEDSLSGIAALRCALVEAHAERFGRTDDLVVGLQLTHSGRFARPNDKRRLEPRILYRHPVLDRKFGLAADLPLLTDDEIGDIRDAFIRAAVLAQRAGFRFVDIKHCHGYLGHEFLSSVDRPGPYGGSFENRTRFVREVIAGIQAEAPGLGIGVRLSCFDFVPFRMGADAVGEPEPMPEGRYRWAFGGDGTGLGIDLAEPKRLLALLRELGVAMVCLSAASPYYNPHLMRPALFPPSDGYEPPEDPLVGVARLMRATAELKASQPDLLVVGSGYTYLQEWLPRVAQAAVRRGMVDAVGLGRMVLAYPEMPGDVLLDLPWQRKKVCRTFSDCTTAPRNGLVSGCYPLDDFYKQRPEAADLAAAKERLAAGR